MIRKIVESRLNKQYSNIINEIDNYMEHKYSESIKETSKKINIVVANEYFDKENKEKIFLGEEPICVKNKENIDIVIPISYFYINTGNVVLVHLLLHALLENKINNSEIFSEVVIDYMAEDISKMLQKKGINITISDYPSYSSDSFYSLMFGEIADFYVNNKSAFIDNFMGNSAEFREDIDSVIDLVEEKAKNIMLNKSTIAQDNIQRR